MNGKLCRNYWIFRNYYLQAVMWVIFFFNRHLFLNDKSASCNTNVKCTLLHLFIYTFAQVFDCHVFYVLDLCFFHFTFLYQNCCINWGCVFLKVQCQFWTILFTLPTFILLFFLLFFYLSFTQNPANHSYKVKHFWVHNLNVKSINSSNVSCRNESYFI